MITCAIYDSSERELGRLKEILGAEMEKLAPDEWDIKLYKDTGQLRRTLGGHPDIDIICLDITPGGAMEILESFRGFYKNAKLMVIADERISPMKYLRPSIHPDALLLRPTGERQMQEVSHELLQSYMDQVYRADPENSYTVETRTGKIILPYSRILYFESRDKKIFAKTEEQEYGFYGTMERLQSILPRAFIRCHRSFLINRFKVKEVLAARNMLVLENKEQVPISRTYRTQVKRPGVFPGNFL